MHLPDEIKNFKPRHEFFIGIDSDGTVFDSMNIKHNDVFYPICLEMWIDSKNAETFADIWARINLYSVKRGVNRFLGLLMAFDMISAPFDYEALRRFCNSGFPLSKTGLMKFMETNPDTFLTEVLVWSDRSDTLFSKLTDGLPPFPHAKDAIRAMSTRADIMIVSSASGKGLEKDWTNAGLMTFVSIAAGQEAGSKAEQIRLASYGRYTPDKILMIGDAQSDLDAVRASGGLFYPIIPGDESNSWHIFLNESLDRFIDGTYSGEYEERLISEFNKILVTL